MEKVSVIVLTYNQENTIRRTLDSILGQQTLYKYCVYIGDDGSSDNTRSICEEYEKSSSLVKLMSKAPNKGVLRNYFDVLNLCEGEYIMVCAGDDWWHNPLKIQLQVEYMEAHPNCSLCHGSYLEYYPTTNTTQIKKGLEIENPTKRLLQSNFISAPTVCYRKKFITQDIIDTFISRNYKVEDYPLWLLLSTKGDFHSIEDPLVSYTIQRGSIYHCKTFEKRMAILESTYQIRKDFVEDNNLTSIYGQLIHDVYNILATQVALLYGNYNEAVSFIGKVKEMDLKWKIKKILICNPLFFRIIHKYCSRNL